MRKKYTSALLIVILIVFAFRGQATAQDLAYVSKIVGCNGNSPCYFRVNDALSDVSSDTEIRVAAGIFNEEVILTTNKIVKLAGGWNPAFDNQADTTTVRTLTVEGESVTVDKIIIQATPYESCCIEGVCAELSARVCQRAGGIPINAPCSPNPCP